MSQLTSANQSLAANLAVLKAFKSQVDQIGKQCREIKITDDTTLAIGTQNLSKASQLSKSIDAKVKAIRKPYNDELKKISVLSTALTKDLEDGISSLKSSIADWEKQRRERESIAYKAMEYIDSVKTRLQQILEGIKDESDCIKAKVYIAEKFPSDDKFGEHLQMAHNLRDEYLDLINTKLTTLQHGLEIDILLHEKVDLISKNIEEAKLEAESKIDSEKTRGARYLWNFELFDIKQVPLDWLTIDEEKIKAYLSENKSELKDGEIIDGIKFYKKLSISA